MSWFVYVVKLADNFSGDRRDEIIKKMGKIGIQCSNYFQTIHLQPFYKKKFGYKEGDLPVAENISKRTLALPFFNDLMASFTSLTVGVPTLISRSLETGGGVTVLRGQG